MVLKYKFKYLSQNNSFLTILDNILSKKGTTYNLSREDDFIFLHVEDEEEKLLKISDEISSELPMSLFLEDFTLEVVPQFPMFNYQYTPDSFRKSYCSNCLTIVENYESEFFYNPFVNCEICGTTCDVESQVINIKDNSILFDNYKQFFEKLALEISQGKKININGVVYSKLEKLENQSENLLCTNIDNLSKIVVGSKQKSVILLSLEKPIIPFNVNAIYKTNTGTKTNKVNIRVAWNLFFYLLSKELKALNIDFLIYDTNIEADIEINFPDEDMSPKISITDEKIFLLENKKFDKELKELYDSIDEKAKAQFMVLLKENELLEKSILNVYVSSKYENLISLYSPKIDGIIDIIKFDLPKSTNEIIENIKKEPKGDKLLENFKNKFPVDFENAINFDISTLEGNTVLSLFKLAEVFLGIEDLYQNANIALLQKGPRVDCKPLKSEKIFNREFDFTKFIKSGMSFKLAGVDEKTLSLGYLESFVYFISDLIDEVNEQFPLDGVSLSGDIVADELFNKIIHKGLSSNVKLYYNKDFPIQL